MWSADQADDKERFLADLRALRDTAALGYDELAARAHYPSDVLKEAENGPSLPGLPILAAYVRACDGDVPGWEERWRRLGFEARSDPGLPVRPAGASPAAVAGARAGISVGPPDAYDPERIKAALRGSHVRSDKVAPASAATGTAAGWDDVAGRGWDAAAGPGEDTGNGSHPAWPRSEASPGAAASEKPPDAATADALRRDPFSTSWLDDSQPIPPVPDAGQVPRAWTDFWTPAKGAAAPPDVQQRPGAPPQDDEPAVAATSWSAFTPSLPKIGAEPAASPPLAEAAASRQSAEPAASRPPAAPRNEARDRYYPLRLLTVIVVAALIGSVLVLILR